MKASLIGLLLLFFQMIEPASARSIVPPYEVIKTANGVPVYFFSSPNVPLFEVKLVFDGGSDFDPEGRSGLSMFAGAMIRRGLPDLDEDSIARMLDDVAGGIEVGVGEELFTVSAFGLNDHANEILKLMFRHLNEPTFPEAPFKRMKTNHIDSIRQLPDSPGALAGHVLDSVIFNGTVKARPGTGLMSEVKKISLAEAKRFYQTMLRPDRLRVLVIGGQDKAEILRHVLTGVEALKCPECGVKAPKLRVWNVPAWVVPPGHVLVVSRPGIPEAYVRMGFLGPKRRVPEFYDLRVAETILSGHFASKLNQVIREKLNLTYSISAGFYFGNTTGSFTLSTSTRNEKIADLLTETRSLLQAFSKGENVSESEVQVAKDYILGSFPLGLQNLYVTANTFFNGVLAELNPSFMDDFSGQISNVTLASMNAAIGRHFQMGKMATVVVGDVSKIAPRLEKAKIKFVVRKPAEFL